MNRLYQIVSMALLVAGCHAHAALYFGVFQKTETQNFTNEEFLALRDADGLRDKFLNSLRFSANSSIPTFLRAEWGWQAHEWSLEAPPLGKPNDLSSQQAAVTGRVLVAISGNVQVFSRQPTRMAPFLLDGAVLHMRSDQELDRYVQWDVTSALDLHRDEQGFFGLRLNSPDPDTEKQVLGLAERLGEQGFWAELVLSSREIQQEVRVRFANASELLALFNVGSDSNFCALLLASTAAFDRQK